jgi:hypothetical protein
VPLAVSQISPSTTRSQRARPTAGRRSACPRPTCHVAGSADCCVLVMLIEFIAGSFFDPLILGENAAAGQ